MNSSRSSQSPSIYNITSAVLKRSKRPIDFDAIVRAVQKDYPSYSEFEIKEAIWSLLQDHEAELTPSRSVRFVR